MRSGPVTWNDKLSWEYSPQQKLHNCRRHILPIELHTGTSKASCSFHSSHVPLDSLQKHACVWVSCQQFNAESLWTSCLVLSSTGIQLLPFCVILSIPCRVGSNNWKKILNKNEPTNCTISFLNWALYFLIFSVEKHMKQLHKNYLKTKIHMVFLYYSFLKTGTRKSSIFFLMPCKRTFEG